MSVSDDQLIGLVQEMLVFQDRIDKLAETSPLRQIAVESCWSFLLNSTRTGLLLARRPVLHQHYPMLTPPLVGAIGLRCVKCDVMLKAVLQLLKEG